MTDYHKFDDIRPYRDEEIPAAMQRIASNSSFPLVAQFVFPELTVEEAAEKIRTGTRHYAKRQMTFLRRDESIRYVRTDLDGAYDEIRRILL